MIAPQEIERMILEALPDAKVEIRDMTGGGDHFEIFVVSKAFTGMTLLEQHKMIFAALEKEMDRGIHAVQLKTRTP